MASNNLPTDPKEFWNLYLHEHQTASNRWLHAIGTLASWTIVVAAIATGRYWGVLFAPLVGYAFAWTGHLLIEKNRPLTLKAPWRSLKCDYRLTLLTLTGQHPKEISTIPVANSEERAIDNGD